MYYCIITCHGSITLFCPDDKVDRAFEETENDAQENFTEDNLPRYIVQWFLPARSTQIDIHILNSI